jgi:membrane associated rhomboid family serine protease
VDHTPPSQPPDPSSPYQSAMPPAVCYRHDDRPTRLSCTSCDKPICVDCTVQAAVGQKCPDCAKPTGRNRIITAAEVRSQTTGLGGAPVTRAIVYVSAAIGALSFVAPDVWSVIAAPLIHDVARVAAGEVHRAVGAALLHSPGSLFHIGFNMYALFLFGPELERRFGSVPFAAFYLASAAAGGVAFQISRDGGLALGASGAIFGLFGAYVTSAFLARKTAAGRAGLRQLMPLLLINLALPLFVPNIAWEAHLGGLVGGAIIMGMWRSVAEDGRGPDGRVQSAAVLRTVIAATLLIASLGALLVL